MHELQLSCDTATAAAAGWSEHGFLNHPSHALASIVTGAHVECRGVGYDKWHRLLARCTADTVDLSCAMLRTPDVVRRHSRIDC